jgi:8-oxo-dGTP diphosphatase
MTGNIGYARCSAAEAPPTPSTTFARAPSSPTVYQPPVTTIHVVGAPIFRDHRCLIAQRSPTMLLPHKWEFPGGKVEPNEAPEAALVREIHEELGLHIQVGPFLARGTALATNNRLIALDVYAAHIVSGTLVLREHAQVQWATPDELPDFDWADADIPIIPAVRAHLLAQSR